MKIKAAVISLMLTLSVLPIVSFAENVNDLKVKTVLDYNIIQGDEKGNLNLNENITRAEMAKIICELLCVDTSCEATCPFTDISADFWGMPFISAVYNRGIVNGYEDMTFRPNDHIIYNDAFKMIVEAINYSFFAETNGGYPAGYQTVAKDLELVARDFVNYTHKVNRYEAGVLIYNVLDIPIARKGDYENGFLLMDGVYDSTSPRMTLRMLHDKSQTQE